MSNIRSLNDMKKNPPSQGRGQQQGPPNPNAPPGGLGGLFAGLGGMFGMGGGGGGEGRGTGMGGPSHDDGKNIRHLHEGQFKDELNKAGGKLVRLIIIKNCSYYLIGSS